MANRDQQYKKNPTAHLKESISHTQWIRYYSAKYFTTYWH